MNEADKTVEQTSAPVKRRTCQQHGKSRSKVYAVWKAMRQRCTLPQHKQFPNYGGRGITVCEKWMTFRGFYEDMGDTPPKHSLDRINNDAGYCKENCRWANSTTQARNKRGNVIIEHDGKKMCLTGWAEFLGIDRSCLRARLNYGYTFAEAIAHQSHKKRPKLHKLQFEFGGEIKTLKQLAEIHGIPYHRAWNRMHNLGWSLEDALSRPSEQQNHVHTRVLSERPKGEIMEA